LKEVTTPDILWFDTETYSECDLKTHGTPRYAEHPSTEIMVAQWALNDKEPEVLDCTRGHSPYQGYINRVLANPNVIVAAHNAFFDRTLVRECWGIDVPVERWYCTMVQAMAHGLPGALGKLGPVLGLPNDEHKDKRGRDLIMLFCKPRPANMTLRRATRETHPKEWAEFLEYSRQEISAMRAVSKAMPTWNYAWPGQEGRLAGHRERKLWHLDQKINDRGFLADTDLAEGAIRATNTEKKRLKEEIDEATDGVITNATQRDQLLAYILAEHGVVLPDMKADTLRRRAEAPELPEAVRLLLNLRLEATKTSTSKYSTLLNMVSADGRFRNGLQFSGAQRTARWAGRGFQPHNMLRPTLPQCVIEYGIEALKANTQADMVPLVLDSVMELAANAVRGCIIAPPGRKLSIADLSNIEGRKLAFLAGEEWKLQAFRDFDAGKGPDLYVAAYARAFSVDPDGVNGGMRQIGKVMELALGYQGGVAAFVTFAAVYRMDLEKLAAAVFAAASGAAWADAQGWWKWAVKKGRTLSLPERIYVACQVLVTAWREAHPATVRFWNDAENAVRKAIAQPKTPFPVGDHIVVQVDGHWLRARLPSGRCVCYLHPKVSASGEITYMGINQYTKQWARIKSYGGKLAENWDQASARDVLAENMPEAEAQGYEIVLGVHDELLSEVDDNDEHTHEGLAAIMAAVPPWAPGLPLAAKGFDTYRYRKD
jgi:DNA polymerase bacteriophage-type